MDKSVLIEYVDMIEEIKEIRRRIRKLEDEITNITVVSDTVKGTRKDGTIGPIKITGYPFPLENRKKALLSRYRRKLEEREEELLELTIKAEEYIESIPKSELRIMFRFYFLDGKTYVKTAMEMNVLFPDRHIKYTEDNVKKKIQRFFKNVPQCPEEKC
ncbi:hypothetical protein [Faecalimonas sp.]